MLFSKNYSISIPEPCHEKWEDMHVAVGGRFCDSCAKNVVDFTGMTEKEIIQYFRNKKDRTCGRFEAGQLQKIYVVKPQIRLPFHQRFLSYLLTFFVSNAIINKASAQTDTAKIAQRDTTAQLAGNDSLLFHPDSLAIAKADTAGCKDDSASVVIDWKFEAVAPEVITYPEFIRVVVVSGDITWNPNPIDTDPTFLDFIKAKYHDSVAVLKKTVGIVEEEKIPSKPETPDTPEKPAKKILLLSPPFCRMT